MFNFCYVIVNNNQQSTITKQDLIGDMMYAGSLLYFASLQSRANLMNLSSNTAYSLLTSNGVFGYEPKGNYIFGIPKTISNGGIVLDLPINIMIKNKDNNKQRQ